MERFSSDVRVKRALQEGVDLREYTKQVEAELKRVEESAVQVRLCGASAQWAVRAAPHAPWQDYMLQANSFADVHAQIKACDAILEGMETVLSGFQSNLGSISRYTAVVCRRALCGVGCHMYLFVQRHPPSAGRVGRHEREALQSASGLCKGCRICAGIRLGESDSERACDFLCRVARPHTTWQNAVIPEDMAKQIFTAEVNETYLEYLAELNRKMDFVKAARSAAVVPLAVQEVEPMLNKLRVKAVAKVREYLLQRIHSLKKPRTNLQMLQHNSLSKFRLLNRFLQSHAPAVFEEVQALYIETLSKLYGSYFQVCGFLLMCRFCVRRC